MVKGVKDVMFLKALKRAKILFKNWKSGANEWRIEVKRNSNAFLLFYSLKVTAASKFLDSDKKK